jgi:hypothetical protein
VLAPATEEQWRLAGHQSCRIARGQERGGRAADRQGVTGCLNPRVDGEACAGEDKGAVEAPELFNGKAVQGACRGLWAWRTAVLFSIGALVCRANGSVPISAASHYRYVRRGRNKSATC